MSSKLQRSRARALDFIEQMTRRQATRTIPVAVGVDLVLNDDFPSSHVQNVVLATAGAVPAGVARALDRQAREGRHLHIHVLIDDGGALGDELSNTLRDRGMKPEPVEIMALTGSLGEAPGDGIDVVEVSGDELDPVVARDWERELPNATSEVVQQLVRRRAAFEAAAPTTYLAVMVDGAVVSRATLFSAAGVGQVEDVNTHPDHRGKGFARATVTQGARRLMAQGNDLIILEAAADDWPRLLYGKLGFTHMAPLPTFTGIE
jgi:ribosomal protein S18 acetylase RimI-like enzyme